LVSLLRRSAWPTAQELEEFAREAVETGGLGIIDWFSAEHPRVVWLGQQFNVRGQAMVVFRRRVSENILIVGGANAPRYGMLAALLACLSVNTKPTQTEFVIFDKSIAGSQWNGILQAVSEMVLLPSGFSVQFSKETNEAEGILNTLLNELERRRTLNEEELANTSSIFAIMTELDVVEALRRKADSYGGMADSPLGEKLKRLYIEGPPLGIHQVLSFAGVRPMANVIDERRGLINFRHRVALQMSEDEAYTFVRSRKASQLQIEGPMPICALYIDVENDSSVRFKSYSSDASTVTQNESLIDQFRVIGSELIERRNHR
jgi:DNA segregation ATPase FtsK/SpoIIIE, S-DNA-T family